MHKNDNKIKLICIPYAGGNSMVFRPWKTTLSPNIELVTPELAGRGARLTDNLYNSINEAAEDLFQILRKSDQLHSYALYGHSMGTLIIVELLKLIKHSGDELPLHIFYSGRGVPHLKTNNGKKFHLMNEEQFRKEVLALGGTPLEIFETPELAELFIPTLKNDFRITETYISDTTPSAYDINISVFIGTNEDITNDGVEGWEDYTTKECRIHFFEGGHFFIKDKQDEVIKTINSTLNRYCAS